MTYEVKRYERKTELICEEKPFLFPEDVQEGDALIAFSKKSVLDVAGRLEEAGISVQCHLRQPAAGDPPPSDPDVQ